MDLITEVILLALSFLAGLFLRFIPHLRFEYPSTSDAYFFMNKFRDPEYESEEVDYPKLLYQLFRFCLRNRNEIPDRTINRITPLFDIITAFFVYVFLRPNYGVEIALLTTLLFLVTPFTVKHGVSFSGRPFGLLLFTVSLLCLTLPSPFDWIAIIPMALVMLSHRLSTQTLFFICAVFAFMNWQVGVILVFGFLLAVILSRGEYVRILRNHAKTIVKYMREGHYPNQRLMGLVLTPSFVGFIFYATIVWLQNSVTFPLQFGYLSIGGIIGVDSYTELLFSAWCAVCLLLLLFWIAGESFRHLYLAAAPFAFFSVFILQSGAIFSVLLLLEILGSIGISVYITVRYDHLDNDFVTMLQQLKDIPEPIKFIVPYGFLRAAEYFSYKKGISLHFPEYDDSTISKRIAEESVTYAVLDAPSLARFKDWKQESQEGNWYLLKRV
jgi:hypothetical protein